MIEKERNQTMWRIKRNKRSDLRDLYRAAERIQTAETPREADILTGYVIGIIDEKCNSGRLTRSTADAIAEMVEAVGKEIRQKLVAAPEE